MAKYYIYIPFSKKENNDDLEISALNWRYAVEKLHQFYLALT